MIVVGNRTDALRARSRRWVEVSHQLPKGLPRSISLDGSVEKSLSPSQEAFRAVRAHPCRRGRSTYPSFVVEALREEGFDVLHATDCGALSERDPELPVIYAIGFSRVEPCPAPGRLIVQNLII